MDIQLNFINQSNDVDDSQIVIFQRNVASGYSELPVAWLVIQHCGVGDSHPFVFPKLLQLAASDSWGNFTPRLDAQPGQAFAFNDPASGPPLQPAGAASYPTEIQILNNLPQGAINAHIYRDGRLLATKTSIAPQQMAAFQFNPVIWIGAVSQAVQGSVLNSATVEMVNTELSLLGIAFAEIVMTGGGGGKGSQPLAFILQNIVRA